ncbi:hypothetical protein ACFQE1_10665, partial [Halobium palmae]
AAVAAAGAVVLLCSAAGVFTSKTAYAAGVAFAAGLPPLLVRPERAVKLQMLFAYLLTLSLFLSLVGPGVGSVTP